MNAVGDQRPELRSIESPRIKCPRPLSISEVLSMPPPSWLINDWLPMNSLILIYGDPASGKTFTALGIAEAIATGMAWNGKKVTQGTVLYIAGEGVSGLGKRIRALATRNPEIFDANIFIIPAAVDLADQAEEVVSRARDLMEVHSNVVLVIIDTLSRTFGGREENSSRDMGDYVRAADKIRVSLGCAVAIVHHAGKDGGRGARGHSSLTGAIDVSLEVTASDTGHTLSCRKQKDGERPQPQAFRLDIVPVGRSDDGEIQTSCVVSYVGAASVAARREHPKGSRQQLIANLAASMLTETGVVKCPLDPSRPALAVDALLLRWKAATIGKSAPSYFRDTLRVMVDRGLMGSDGVLVWLP